MVLLSIIEFLKSVWFVVIVLFFKNDCMICCCKDYWKLNEVMIKDVYFLFDLNDCLDFLVNLV